MIFAGMIFLLASPALSGSSTYTDDVIDADTMWDGEVSIAGPLVVKKGATLTILPGASIRFKYVDPDGDGIGDSEINVEGTLIARGAKDSPITFTSFEDDPKPRDWKYIIFQYSKGSVMEYCEIRHAFTGVQTHWSDVIIHNNLFTENFEGLRFSTAIMDVRHNTFTGNEFAVRYEARGSKGAITMNDITGNGCGFFAVVKCEGDVEIMDNNIVNENYNLKLGMRQTGDLDYIGNWWGSAEPEEIEYGIFDGRADETLGMVSYEPVHDGPVEGAGIE
jgi:hypothetical protein